MTNHTHCYCQTEKCCTKEGCERQRSFCCLCGAEQPDLNLFLRPSLPYWDGPFRLYGKTVPTYTSDTTSPNPNRTAPAR